MKLIIPTTQYKKDLKRYTNQRKKMEGLLEILRCLANEDLFQRIAVHIC